MWNIAVLFGSGRKSLLALLAVALSCLVAHDTAFAAIIAYDGFSYANGDLNGQNGGTGWAGAWSATGVVDQVAGNALTFSGSGDHVNAAVRSFSSQSGNDLYFSFRFTFTGGITGDTAANDFLGLWIDGVPAGNAAHTNIPNIGIKVNQGPGGNDYFVRVNSGEQYSDHDVTLGETVQLVGHLSKNGGSNYSTFALWVNPQLSQSAEVTAIDGGSIDLASVNRVGFRIVNLDASPQDVLTIDDLTIADSFDSVVTPEPASRIVWGGLSVLGFLVARSRRTKHRA